MKILREIRDYFLPAYSVKYADPENDIIILSIMGRQVEYLVHSKTGKRYFYYFLSDGCNLDVAKYLFRRNGVPVVKHNTHYNWSAGIERVLRVPMSVLENNERVNDFVRQISPISYRNNISDYDERIKIIKRQKMGYER